MALRRSAVALLTLTLLTAVALPVLRSQSTQSAKTDTPDARATLAGLPLSFQPEKGSYLARGPHYALQLSEDGMTLRLDRGRHGAAFVTTKLERATRVRPVAEGRLPGVVNEYRGAYAREAIPTFARIRYRSVYPGIDAVFHGRESAVEYDFEVRPGASPGQIAVSHGGARSLTLAGNGDLLLHLPDGVLRSARPVAYQVIGGRRVHVDASYRLDGGRVRFSVGNYDQARELVIDPVLSYSSYLGGSDEDYLMKLAVGSDKKVYIAGRTLSNDFPGGTRDNARTDVDAFVTKLNPDGSRVYTSYVGSTGLDQAFDVAADSSGRAYVVGNTDSTAFAPFALDSCADGGYDAFIVRLDAATGALSYRTCIGGDGDDAAAGIALRESGGTPEAYIVGETQSVAGAFPQNNGFLTTCCTSGGTFFAKVSFGASVTIPYLTFIDGASSDRGRAVAVDSAGNAYVAGQSSSNPLAGTAKPGAGAGVFVTRINPAVTGAASKIYSSWVDGAGSEDVGNPDSPPYGAGSIAVNSSGVAYVAGSTGSSDLPLKVTHDTFKYISGDAGFITAINSAGTVLKTIYVDGTGATHLTDLGLQEIGGVTSIYAIGDTDGTISGINTLNGQSCADTSTFIRDVVLVKIADGTTPTGVYFTCLGSTGDDAGTSIAPGPGTDATAWIIGTTTGSFPTVNPQQANANAVTDGFVARISQAPPVIDSGPDEGAVIPSRGATFAFSTDQPALTFRCSAPDAGKLVAGNALGACSDAGAAAYSDLADGQHTFEVVTVDAAGAESARATRTFTVDTAPPNASYVIAPNPVLVGRPASFDAGGSTPTSGPIVRYEWDLDGDGSFETDTGGSPTTAKTYTAAGTVNTALRVTDSTGASGIAGVQLLVTDPSSVGTQVGVTINKGAQYTNKPDVTLSIVFPASATGMLISNDGGFLNPFQTTPKTSVKWTLESSGPERLPKTVYVRFLTGTFASPNFTDDIILDERPPVVRSASVAGSAAASSAQVAALKRWKVRVKATDTNSGVAGVQVTANKRKPGRLIKYRRKLRVKSAKRPKFLRAKDRAGNYSRWKKLR